MPRQRFDSLYEAPCETGESFEIKMVVAMGQLELWKLGTDLLLVLSLGVLCYRLLRGQAGVTGMNREVRHLESTLRELVREADIASQGLNDKLSRRQQTLEKLLDELSESERNVRRSIARAETQADERVQRERQLGRTSENQRETPIAPIAARAAAANPAPRPAATQRIETKDEENQRLAMQVPPVVSPRAPMAGTAQEQPAPLDQPVHPGSAVARWQAANATAPTSYEVPADDVDWAVTRRLAQEIEREIVPQFQVPAAATAPSRAAKTEPATPPPARPVVMDHAEATTAIDDVYERAEALIKAGKDLAQIAQSTKLPMNEIRVLSQVVLRSSGATGATVTKTQSFEIENISAPAIEAESELLSEQVSEQTVRTADPRLGVLSPIRRQIQTL